MMIREHHCIVGTDGQWGDFKQSSETGSSGPLWGNAYRWRHPHPHRNSLVSSKMKMLQRVLWKSKCFIGKSALIVGPTNLNICFYILVDNKPKGFSTIRLMMMMMMMFVCDYNVIKSVQVC